MKLAQLLALSAALTALSCLSTSNGATITVNKTGDSGAGTLRQAIADNEAAGGGNAIDFSVTGAIMLTSGELRISQNVTITGPGARLLTVQYGSGPKFRIFTVAAPVNGSVTVSISGVTIANGFAPADDGGGIYASLNSTVTMSNCTISGNHADFFGGGLLNIGTMTLANCTISGNDASGNNSSGGGGIYNQGMLTMTNCTLADNTAGLHGGGLFNNVTVIMRGCTVASNSTTGTPNPASGAGGGIYNNAGTPARTLQIGNTIVAGNTLTGSGGVGPDVNGNFMSDGYNLIRNGDGSTGFTGVGDQVGTTGSLVNANLSPLQNNGGPTDTKKPVSPSNAIDQGKNIGGLTTDQRGRLRISDDPNEPNAFQGDGTDIGAFEVQPSITSTVTNNNDTGDGSLRERILDANAGDTLNFAPNVTGTIMLTSGALLIERSLTIDGPGARILAVSGAGIILEDGTIEISGLTLTAGGGLTIDGGTTTVIDCTISNNNGHGIAVGPAATLAAYRCTIVNNQSSLETGGGVQNAGMAFLTNCTIANNGAPYAVGPGFEGGGQGGGIANSGTLTVLNCTLSGNTATGAPSGKNGGGGGIYNFNGSPATLTNTLLASNTTDQNGTGPDLQGDFISGGSNLIRINNGSTGFPVSNTKGDLVGTSQNPENAFLDPLQDNGGPTDTRSLGSGSPAIDAGSDTKAPPTDQRGASRVGVSDIGAFEFGGVVPTPTPTPTATPIPATLANISTRLRVETADNALIGGFIVTGTQSKKIMLRAIGPSLPFADKLADPILELHDSSGALLEGNDNWVDSANKQAIIDSTIPPTNDLESAILRSVPPGDYTAVVRGVNDGTGIGVVEAYDLDTSTDSKLANISTRGLVQTGDDVLIAGTIVVGQSSQKVIIRALGPSVPVPGAMADPTLELRDGNGALLEANDNWVESTNKQAIIDSTIPPPNDLESAIVRTIAPGNYTAIVRGVNDSSGVAVVEVYALQ